MKLLGLLFVGVIVLTRNKTKTKQKQKLPVVIIKFFTLYNHTFLSLDHLNSHSTPPAHAALQVEATVEITDFKGGKDFNEKITRAKFEELCLDLFKKTLQPVDKVLQVKRRVLPMCHNEVT